MAKESEDKFIDRLIQQGKGAIEDAKQKLPPEKRKKVEEEIARDQKMFQEMRERPIVQKILDGEKTLRISLDQLAAMEPEIQQLIFASKRHAIELMSQAVPEIKDKQGESRTKEENKVLRLTSEEFERNKQILVTLIENKIADILESMEKREKLSSGNKLEKDVVRLETAEDRFELGSLKEDLEKIKALSI